MRTLSAALLFTLLASADDITPDTKFHNWTRVAMAPTLEVDPNTQWTVSEGVLKCQCRPGRHEFLRFDRELTDFDLHVEWRFVPVEGNLKYNSGVYVRNSPDGKVWFQAQIGAPANAGYFFYDAAETNGARRRVSLKTDMPSHPVTEPGQWNSYDVQARGNYLTLTVNGEKTSAFDCGCSSGYVGLEAEYYPIEFRNIRLDGR